MSTPDEIFARYKADSAARLAKMRRMVRSSFVCVAISLLCFVAVLLIQWHHNYWRCVR
jgi:hypothetical protein